MQSHSLGCADDEHLESCVEVILQTKLFTHNRDEHITTDCSPDFGLYRVSGIPVEVADSQVALDPLKEQIHSPSILLEKRNNQRCLPQMIDKSDKKAKARWIVVE